jgi:hypothetical protein
MEEEMVELPLKADLSLSMTELLIFAGKNLEISILFDACITDDISYRFTGPVEIPQSKFQGYFERLLLEKRMVLAGTGDDLAALYAVLDMAQNRRTSMGHASDFTAQTVAMDELPEYAERGILINVSVPLEHINARGTVTSLNAYFQNHQVERLRPVEDSNALIRTAPAIKIWRIKKLIDQMDKPTPESAPGLKNKVKELEEKIEALEKRMESLVEKKQE